MRLTSAKYPDESIFKGLRHVAFKQLLHRLDAVGFDLSGKGGN